jgi:transcription initiation factor IIE alpha subunit
LDRYHKRVYRILRVNSYLDENSVVKRCFLPPKDVRKILNTLFQEGIVVIQNVPTKAGNSITLYHSDFEKTKDKFYSKILKSLLNVKIRIEDMRQKLQEKVVTYTKEHVEVYEKAISKLEYVIRHLEYSLMIFDSF